MFRNRISTLTGRTFLAPESFILLTKILCRNGPDILPLQLKGFPEKLSGPGDTQCEELWCLCCVMTGVNATRQRNEMHACKELVIYIPSTISVYNQFLYSPFSFQVFI